MESMSDRPRTGSLSRAGGVVDEFLGDVKDQARDIRTQYIEKGWNQTRDFVKENPGKTLLLATGVGMLLGAVLARRR